MPNLLFVFALSMMGCDSSSSGPSGPSPHVVTGVPPNLTMINPVPDVISPSIPDEDRPKTLDEFTAQLKSRFANNLYEPFIELAYWGASSNAQKRKYLVGVQATYTVPSSRHLPRIDSTNDIEVFDIKDYEKEHAGAYYPKEGEEEGVKLIPEPTNIVRVTAHFGQTVKVDQYYAVGIYEGKYYFSTVEHAP